MLDTVKTLIVSQYEAALSMLKACVDGCPDTMWNAQVANHRFSQVVFHVLYFTDLHRHINHHAAQLSLRLRLDTGEGIKWVGSGWREAAHA